ncbi:growth arrest-specific protein 1-like [Petromyzon marinus]|uniref:Growth arrest-specific protein 1-like n=1 Tax=Petromyzon marinus TaxID=7757 RepID=A0AAJ7XCV3_PETMA|nr:growth arrest-specific protein 1-like [Petromyzon marinus]
MDPLHPCRVLLSLLLLCWAPLALSSASSSSSQQQQQARPCWEAIVRCSQEAECKRAYDGYVSACESVRGGGGGGALEGAGRHGGGGHGGGGHGGGGHRGGGGGSDDGWHDGGPMGVGHGGRGGGGGGGGGDRSGGAARSRCPTLCITALVQLNQTRSGPALESCDCGREPRCLRTKSALEPCLPRTFTAAADHGGGGRRRVGCTDARHRCLEEPRCSETLDEYLRGCGQLFNGARCSPQCRAVIERMLSLQGARQLSDCVCDGIERPFCEAVKRNMAELCFDGEDFLAGSGDFGSYGGGGGDDDDDGDDDDGGGGGGGVGGGVNHRHPGDGGRGGGGYGGGVGARQVDCPPGGAVAPSRHGALLAAVMPLLVATLLSLTTT